MADMEMEPSVVLTEKIQRCIDAVLSQESLEKCTRHRLEAYSKRSNTQQSAKPDIISFTDVQNVHRLLQTKSESVESDSNADKPIYLHELLEGSELYLPKLQKPERNPELEARIQRLKAQQANREYNAMTKNISSQGKTDFKSFGQEMKEVNKQLTVIFNCVLTVGGSFVFGYFGTQLAMDNATFYQQMINGCFLALVVFIADMYFIIKSEL